MLPDHAVLIGDNNTGKLSLSEAIDLALGPDRLSWRPPVDEHAFYQGRYLPILNPEAPEGAEQGPAPKITVEVTITNLSPEQEARFGANVEWLNTTTGDFFQEANPAGGDAAENKAALRVTFVGEYDPDEEDFVGNSYFTRSLSEDDTPASFSKKDKCHCVEGRSDRVRSLFPEGSFPPSRPDECAAVHALWRQRNLLRAQS